ncbi:MAG TPA: N-acetylmuramic acid 6-phosphate etherase [Thermomicrobiales bacterium]
MDRTSDTSANLTTEAINPATRDLDCLDALGIVTAMNAEDARVAEAVRNELPRIAEAVEAIAERLRAGGRLIYVGAGTSGRLGALDAAECIPTFSVPPGTVVALIAGGPAALTEPVEGAEDDDEAGRVDLLRLGVSEADAVVGIAASGRTPYVLGAMRHAAAIGALTIGIACNTGTPLEKLVEIMIAPVVGPEVIAGSTRLKAGTAQKMVLNMLSTGAMVRLGKTFGNLMVDLQATNSKLRARAVRIVQAATGLDHDEAAAALSLAGGEVKTAIVAVRAGVSPEEARQRLSAAGGSVRAALGEAAPCPN